MDIAAHMLDLTVLIFIPDVTPLSGHSIIESDPAVTLLCKSEITVKRFKIN